MTIAAVGPRAVPLAAARANASSLARSTVVPAPPDTTSLVSSATDTMQSLSLVTSSLVHSWPPALWHCAITRAEASSFVAPVALKPTRPSMKTPVPTATEISAESSTTPPGPPAHAVLVVIAKAVTATVSSGATKRVPGTPGPYRPLPEVCLTCRRVTQVSRPASTSAAPISMAVWQSCPRMRHRKRSARIGLSRRRWRRNRRPRTPGPAAHRCRHASAITRLPGRPPRRTPPHRARRSAYGLRRAPVNADARRCRRCPGRPSAEPTGLGDGPSPLRRRVHPPVVQTARSAPSAV
jgi:hypothetical protein